MNRVAKPKLTGRPVNRQVPELGSSELTEPPFSRARGRPGPRPGWPGRRGSEDVSAGAGTASEGKEQEQEQKGAMSLSDEDGEIGMTRA
eukprot:766512-Hanusia_phi.AAC.4